MDLPNCTRPLGTPQLTKLQRASKRHTMKENRENARAKQNIWRSPQNLMNLKLFNQWIVMAGNNFKSCMSSSAFRPSSNTPNHPHTHTHTNPHSRTICLHVVLALHGCLFIPHWFLSLIWSTIFVDFTWADARLQIIHTNRWHNFTQMKRAKVATCWIISVLDYKVPALFIHLVVVYMHWCGVTINANLLGIFYFVWFALQPTVLCTASVDETPEQQQAG